jgi:hypothetical protein
VCCCCCCRCCLVASVVVVLLLLGLWQMYCRSALLIQAAGIVPAEQFQSW